MKNLLVPVFHFLDRSSQDTIFAGVGFPYARLQYNTEQYSAAPRTVRHPELSSFQLTMSHIRAAEKNLATRMYGNYAVYQMSRRLS